LEDKFGYESLIISIPAGHKHFVEEAINALLANKPVPVTKTKSTGCGIRWKD
jgi:hypothetical protein